MGFFDRCACPSKAKSQSVNGNDIKLGKEAEAAGAEEAPDNRTAGRGQWASPTEFMLTCVGYSVGLGNVWRFPYLCYISGGGAFLIPYIIMMFCIGMPLLFMEYSFGQYFGIGSLSIFKKVCPMFQGIGIGYVVLNALVCIYYNVIIAISLYYLFGSLTSTLPWGSCGHEWNDERCSDLIRQPECNPNATGYNLTEIGGNLTSTLCSALNSTVNGTNVTTLAKESPSDQYFRYALLNERPEHNISNLGEIRWHLCLCLLLAWILVVLFVSRGIQSTGKVAYFTATFPYVMLTVLVVRGATLTGAADGIKFFVQPEFEMLKSPDVWYKAAVQLFYSTNLAWGGMITMSSYNDFRHNCFRDAIVVNCVSFFTSLYAGFAVFSIIGFMANEAGVPISEVIKSGPGLAFIAYPRALSLMPLAPMWSALFFFMLFLLGIGSQMVILETIVTGFVDKFPVLGLNALVRFCTTCSVAIVLFITGIAMTTQMVLIETVVTSFVDEFPLLGMNKKVRFLTTLTVAVIMFLSGVPMTSQMVQVETIMTGIVDNWPMFATNWRRRLLLVIGVCSLGMIIGLPMVTQGGMYVLNLMDHYSAGFCVLVIALTECVVINWIYGNHKFACNVKEMLGTLPHVVFRLCWRYISPLLILAILIFNFVRYQPARYNETYRYPAWADGIGWMMTLASVIPIIIVAVVKMYQANGSTLREKWSDAIKPIVSGTGELKESGMGGIAEVKELNPENGPDNIEVQEGHETPLLHLRKLDNSVV